MLNVYLVWEHNYFGMDGDFYTVHGVYVQRSHAEKKMSRLESRCDRRNEHEYNWTEFYIEKQPLLAEVKNER